MSTEVWNTFLSLLSSILPDLPKTCWAFPAFLQVFPESSLLSRPDWIQGMTPEYPFWVPCPLLAHPAGKQAETSEHWGVGGHWQQWFRRVLHSKPQCGVGERSEGLLWQEVKEESKTQLTGAGGASGVEWRAGLAGSPGTVLLTTQSLCGSAPRAHARPPQPCTGVQAKNCQGGGVGTPCSRVSPKAGLHQPRNSLLSPPDVPGLQSIVRNPESHNWLTLKQWGALGW